MRYLICGGGASVFEAVTGAGACALADGEMLVLEGPWPMRRTLLAFLADQDAIDRLAALEMPGAIAYTVEGLAAPGAGEAFVIAAHKMLDAAGFRPYAEAIQGVLDRFGVRTLARGGAIKRLAGNFAPDRGVVLEFPTVESVIAFYTSEIYAPLLRLRLRTTDPRFVVLARSGAIPPEARRMAEAYLDRGENPCRGED
jgi:uncharacterized protein (DUF1330 family)